MTEIDAEPTTAHGPCRASHQPDHHGVTEVHCQCGDGAACTVFPGPGADGVARYLAEHCGTQAAFVMQSGSADEMIAGLVAQGWTLNPGAELINGKRLRTMIPPPGWKAAEPDGTAG